MGLDVAVFRYSGFVERSMIWSGVDAITTGDRAAEEYKARMVCRINVDGAGVAPHMQRLGCAANRIMVASGPTEKTDIAAMKSKDSEIISQNQPNCRFLCRIFADAMAFLSASLADVISCRSQPAPIPSPAAC
jgi:hypothetical protein